jgi:DNA polymerase I-like protein with 3'-5' exonuclease and polymerase domains
MPSDPFLQRPGISSEFLRAAGVEYVTEPEPQLRIPYFDITGKPSGHWRTRLQRIRPTGQKYDQPAGSKSEVYLSHIPLSQGLLLFITEGEFKCMSLVESGFPAIGLPGLHCYVRDTNDQPQLLPAIHQAVELVRPAELCFIGDSDTATNLEYYRSAGMLSQCFRQIQLKLIQLPLGGPKGIDDLRDQLDGQFPVWLAEAKAKALTVNPDDSFLISARLQLEAALDIIVQLPAAERERHIHRSIQMAVLARLAKDQPATPIIRFCEVVRKVTGFTKPEFEKAIADEISRLTNNDQVSIESEPPSFDETVKPWPEPVDGAELVIEMEKFIRRFVVLEQSDYRIIPLAVLESYLVDCFNALGIIWVRSAEKRCGKSTLLDVMEKLVLRPLLCITASPASLYRLIEKYHPSLIVDEADNFGSENEDIRKIANGGYERGRRVPRVNNDTGEVELFDTFGFKILASIGSIHETVEDRSITIHMTRKSWTTEVEDISDLSGTEFEEFKRKCQRWAVDHAAAIKSLCLSRPKPLFDRNWKKWRPLLSIALEIGEDRFVKTLALAIHKVRTSESSEPSIKIEILSRIRELFREKSVEFLPTTDILRYLNQDKEAPWADWLTGAAKGLTARRLSIELAQFPIKSDRPQRSGFKASGYWLKDFLRFFEVFLPPDNDSGSGSSPSPGTPSPFDSPPSPPENEQRTCLQNVSASESTTNRGGIEKKDPVSENLKDRIVETNPAAVDHSLSTTYEDETGSLPISRGLAPVESKRDIEIPDSTARAGFCIVTRPELFVALDLETFYPWGAEEQPKQSDPGQLKRRQKRGLAHPYAKDPRRCAIRFLTIHTEDGIHTHDMYEGPVPEWIQELLRSRTIIGHNLDFDINVLRRYGITISDSIRDTMLAARLLGLGKEKAGQRDVLECEIIAEDGELDTVESEADGLLYQPTDNALDAVVHRYLGIRIPKTIAKIGGSDWSVQEITEMQREYIRWDVEQLPALWERLEVELTDAKLSDCFAERMRFFVNLHRIKMTGIPVNTVLRDSDREKTAELKNAKREDVRRMFSDYKAPVPKSRRKKVKAVKDAGGIPVISAPTIETEDFNPNVPAQVVDALALHGIEVENAQKETLQRIKAPETELLLDYAEHKARLSAIDGIVRSTFPDGRIRPAGWNQLSARTGRVTSVEPNLQNLPKAWRHAFEAPRGYYWLTIDLSQIEVYVIAIHTSCERMISILSAGKDIYVETAAHIFGLDPVRGPEEGQVTEVYRNAVKPLVLGINYGLTIFGFIHQVRVATGLEFSLEEAETHFEQFFELYPEIKAYHDRALEEAEYATEIRTSLGQRRFLPPLKDDRDDRTGYWPSLEYRKRTLLNTPIQAGACLLLIGAVNEFLPQLPKSVQAVNLVHDEFNGLAPKELLLPAYRVISVGFDAVFRRFYGDRLQVKVEGYAGKSWADKNKLHPFLKTL